MCGIAGFLTVEPDAQGKRVLERMTSVLHHRGPDEYGYYAKDTVFLGHRRLSIVDLATGRTTGVVRKPQAAQQAGMAFEELGVSLEVFGDRVFSKAGVGNVQLLQRAHI